jgi:myo-inositol-1-phosphate synthase
MENKPSLLETLSWLKEKLENRGNYSTMFQDIFNHEEGRIQIKILAFNFDDVGNIILWTKLDFSNWTEERRIEEKTEYRFNVKSLNNVTTRRVHNDDTVKRDSAMNTIELNSYNLEKKFECIDILKGTGTTLVNRIPIPIADDNDLIQRIKKAFEYIIANFGDNRRLAKPNEPF